MKALIKKILQFVLGYQNYLFIFSLFTILAEPAMAFILLMRASILLVDLLGLKTILSSLRDLEI